MAIPDQTRPNISEKILPFLVKVLLEKDAKEVRICIGTGLHRNPTEDEIRKLIPLHRNERIKVYINNALDKKSLSFLGHTRFGTPVWIMKHFAESDIKIAVSVVEEHQFAGFSGGAKAVAIGLGGEETISGNHSKMKFQRAKMGVIDGNPVREEIDEIGEMVGLDLLINSVLNEKKEIIGLFVGEHPHSHRMACEFVKKISGIPVKRLYDLVVVSPGGYPRDIDLYQSQKALAVAQEFCKPGGTIVLLAECSKGFGDEGGYVPVLERARSPEEVIENFDFSNFKVGPHKAFLIAQTLIKCRVKILSTLPAERLRNMFFEPIVNFEEAIKEIEPKSSVCVIPNASQIIPVQGKEEKL